MQQLRFSILFALGCFACGSGSAATDPVASCQDACLRVAGADCRAPCLAKCDARCAIVPADMHFTFPAVTRVSCDVESGAIAFENESDGGDTVLACE